MSADDNPAEPPRDSHGSGRDDAEPGDDRIRDDQAGAAGPAGSLTLDDLTEAVMELGRTVTELAADVEDLRTRDLAGGPWWNTDVLHSGDVERLRGTVVAFGDYLKATYALTMLPHRWEDDPALLAEIAALYVGWVGAYREPRARAAEPLQWHEALARAVDRIRGYQDRRRQRDSVHQHTAQPPPLPMAFIPQPARAD